jgi:hypothetical protein
VACGVGPFDEGVLPPVFCVCLCRARYDAHVESRVGGGGSILWYCLMMWLVILFHSLSWIASYCLMCLCSSLWKPYMLLDSVISSLRMYSYMISLWAFLSGKVCETSLMKKIHPYLLISPIIIDASMSCARSVGR